MRTTGDHPRLGRRLLLGFAGGVAVFLLAALAAELADRPFEFVAREPATAVSPGGCTGVYCAVAGSLATATALIWFFGAIAALLGAWLLAGDRGRAEVVRTLLLAGGLTLAMVADDIFLIHDHLLDAIVSQLVPTALYGLGALLLGRRLLQAGERELVAVLALAVAFLAASAGLDRVWDDGPNELEDGAKLFGVVAWTVLLLELARGAVEPLRPGPR